MWRRLVTRLVLRVARLLVDAAEVLVTAYDAQPAPVTPVTDPASRSDLEGGDVLRAASGDIVDQYMAELWRALASVAAVSKTNRPDLLALHLTVDGLVEDASLERVRAACGTLGAQLAMMAESSWMVLEPSPAGRWHVHGLALARQPADELVQRWCALVGASPGGQRIEPLRGSRGTWTPRNRQLGANLRERIKYALKSIPRPPTPEILAERVLAGGDLGEAWSYVTATACHSSDPVTATAVTAIRTHASLRRRRPMRDSRSTTGRCTLPGCEQPLSPDARADTVYHSAACRQAASRARRRAGAT